MSHVIFRQLDIPIHVLLNQDLSVFENTNDQDQLASDEAIWSVSTMFFTQIENTCLKLEHCLLTW